MPTPKNLVWQTTTGTGTGNLTLATKYKTLAAAFGTGATQNVFAYFITHQTAAQWEYGTGHMSDATTLVRDTVIESSNANALVDFLSGIKNVTNCLPAEHQTFSSTASRRTVTVAGDVTIVAATDDVVIVDKTIEAATNVNFPTVAARIAAGKGVLGIRNKHSNPALYPITPVRSGTDTIDDTATPLPQDHNRLTWYAPIPGTNDWEIQ